MSAPCSSYVCPTGANVDTVLRADFNGGVIELIKNTPNLANVYSAKLVDANPLPWTNAELESIIATLLAQNTTLTGYNVIQSDGTSITPIPYRNLVGLESMHIYESFDPAIEIDITQLRTAYSAMENGLQNEYCYYFGRYTCAINAYIDIVSVLLPNQPSTTAQNSLITAKMVNFKIRTILNVYSLLITKLKETVASNSTTYDNINAKIKANQTALAHQDTTMLHSVLDTQKEMVMYTTEKNKQTRNQLILYGGLNAVALGILVMLLR